MSIRKTEFGLYNKEKVYSFLLDNGNGLKAEILSFGGIIRKLIYNNVDVVLGRETIEEYSENDGYLGAIIGRCANRIQKGHFSLNGKDYSLFINNGVNSLHGGKTGFNAKLWQWEKFDEDEPRLELTYLSPDMEEGFPGNLLIKVKYTLTRNNAIKIEYKATCDKDTIVNLTNHSYFNLNGHTSGTIDEHILLLKSSFYTPTDDTSIPTGEIISVSNNEFDFKVPKPIGQNFNSSHPQIVKDMGYDHNFIIDGTGYRHFARCTGNLTNIQMDAYTTQGCVQFYTANYLNGSWSGKDGEVYKQHAGFCLETQAMPNAINTPHFPSVVLKTGEEYRHTTVYEFSNI